MKLVRYTNSYADPFANLNQWLDDAFFGYERSPSYCATAKCEGRQQLPVNIHEDGDNYYVSAELPGWKKKEVKVELEGNVLKLGGEREVKRKDQTSKIRFARSIELGTDVNNEAVKAKISDGILTVTLPRKEASKPRTISIS